ncbi:PASTA domain-containing protein [Pseudonocardia dioxanivorans]|uniref:PASTA domain-containing protein n=1 Tax=Pseudonocardia dioxanivorans TaxID=240495 RepID=UPI00031959D0|nr:PASTA domain-containing protein [Pseudonocardia dioxanivorans]
MWLPLLVIGVVVVAIAGAIVIVTTGSGTAPGKSAAGSASSATVPNVVGMRADHAIAALNSAGFGNVSTSFTGELWQRTVLLQNPAALTTVGRDTPVVLSVSVPAPRPTPVPTTVKPPPLPAKAITAREWALIARSPDAHIGEAVIVYGQVTQFDSATGPAGFRANVDGVAHKVSYGYADYDTNTILVADTAATLGDLVNKDLFKAEVTVLGSYTYETTMGGSTTVPKLAVQKVTVTGQAK